VGHTRDTADPLLSRRSASSSAGTLGILRSHRLRGAAIPLFISLNGPSSISPILLVVGRWTLLVHALSSSGKEELARPKMKVATVQ